MKSIVPILMTIFIILLFYSCKQYEKPAELNIIFLHHSTGRIIWNGINTPLKKKVIWRINKELADSLEIKARLPYYFKKYNNANNKNYMIKEQTFPKDSPYGWNNFPYDYYNIWVKNAGAEPYMEEPTLEILTQKYDVIIFKHCFPVINIQEDQDSSDVNSDIKTISNYKLQYSALRDKLLEFPETKFILFTGAAQAKSNATEDEAKRAKEFFTWVINEWDVPKDNIYLWDLYSLGTQDELYLKGEYAVSSSDSHPNNRFARKAVKLLFNRIIDVIENNGEKTRLTGENK